MPGLQLAKRPHERTCGKRVAGLRRAKLRPAAPCGRKFILQNESHVSHLRAAACGMRASSATNCGPPPGGGCGPLGPDGPIPTRDKPAAERTGLQRGGAALRPGRLRAADRCAIDSVGKHFHPNLRAADVCDVEFIARHPKNNSRADEQRRPPGEPSPFPENTAARVQLRTFTFLFLTFTASPSIELPCTEITSRPPSELE